MMSKLIFIDNHSCAFSNVQEEVAVFSIFHFVQFHENTQTINASIHFSVLCNFPTLTVALSPKPTGSY